MRVGLLGDTHGELRAAQLLIRRMGSVQALLHTGDYYDDAMQMSRWPELQGVLVRAVLGNGDYALDGPRQALVELEGRRVWLVHGHRFGVKQGLGSLVEEARRQGAEVVVFGHTHVSLVREQSGILLVNPGSPRFPRGQALGSAAVLEISPEGIVAEILELIQ